MDPHNLPDITKIGHCTPLQIRFSDVDVLGHVNNTVYLAFYDTGKARYFSEITGRNINWKEVDTVIANVDCAFISPIFYGEEIQVYTGVESISEKSFRLLQVIARSDGQIKSACRTVMVSFDVKDNKAVPLPEMWRRALERELEKRE